MTTKTLPKAATDLMAHATAYGWKTATAWGVDSGGADFVTVGLKSGATIYKITWHSRETGTLRLFGKGVEGNHFTYRDAPSVKGIKEHIAAGRCPCSVGPCYGRCDVVTHHVGNIPVTCHGHLSAAGVCDKCEERETVGTNDVQ